MHETGLDPVYGIHHKTGARTGNILSVPHSGGIKKRQSTPKGP